MEQQINQSIYELAGQTLCRYAEAIAKNLEGTLQAEDIEPVHQVRVACRRLRTALRLFAVCLDKKLLRRWRKESKRLLKGFQKARDLDVQIQFLNDFLPQIPPSKKDVLPGLKRLLLRLRQQRQRFQKRLLKSIDRFRRENILSEIFAETERLKQMQGPAPASGLPSAADLAKTAVREAMERTLALLPCLQEKENIQGHHRLRIAVKRLRYTLEILQPVFQEEGGRWIQPLKKMQTLLGDLNDCAVWLEQIEQFSTDEEKRTQEYFGHARPFKRLEPGIEFLRRNRKQQWQVLYREASAYCRKLEKDRFWDQLAEAAASSNAIPLQQTYGQSPA
ncbi:MAG: CHAD domain-containing protein [Anaerohalosphaeraceae bacterium]